MAESTHTDSGASKAAPDRARGRRGLTPDAGLGGVGPAPLPLPLAAGDTLADLLAKVDDNQRAEVVMDMQETHGNAYVQRVLHREPNTPASIPDTGRNAPAVPPADPRHQLNAGQVKWGKHAGFPAVMGQTYYAHNDIEKWPSFRTVPERSIWPWGWQANISKTDAAGGIWDALATPENEEGYAISAEHPDHPGYQAYVRESGSAANNIAQAEQQHINDLDTGWDITGIAAKNAINAAADEEPEVRDNEIEAKNAAIDKVVAKAGALGPEMRRGLQSGGSLEPSLGPMMDNSFVQSKTQRDDSGKHKIPVNYVMTDDENNRVLLEVDPEHVLDGTASSSVVNIGTVS
ncbi:MAG TPA: hypothetical protein VIB47_00685 [Dehalococcoidia bacterium]